MKDRTHQDSGSTHIIRYALEMGLLWIDGDGRDKVREALDALDILEAQLSERGAGGVGPLMGQPQEMPDLSALTERGAKAWAGVDAQGLREGAASAGSEPAAPVQNPAEIEHVAGDVSKNGAGSNMAYAELPEQVGWRDSTYHCDLYYDPPYRDGLAPLFTADQMRAFADATHALRTQQPAPAEVVYSTPEEMFDAILTPQPSPTAQADSQPAQVVDQKSANLSDKAACASPVIDKPAPVLDRDRTSPAVAGDVVAWQQGSLTTMNQDPYPALGAWFVQFWEGADVAARVYGNDAETLRRRCAAITAPQSTQAQAGAITPPPIECNTEDLKKAYAFGWWSALEKQRETAQAGAVPLTDEQIKALTQARSTAMRMAAEGRIPECGDFAAIAQNLDWLCDSFGIKGGQHGVE